MCHKENPSKVKLLNDGVQVSLLILGRVRVARGFVRSPPPKKIKGDDAARKKIGNKAIIEMKVVRKAVHQNDAWLFARALSGVNTMLTPAYGWLRPIHLVFQKQFV